MRDLLKNLALRADDAFWEPRFLSVTATGEVSMRTPHISRPNDSTQAKVWIDDDVLSRLDLEAVNKERSRSWLIDRALREYFAHLDRSRASSKRKRQGQQAA